MQISKTCSSCHQELSLELFHKRSNGKLGRYSKCKPCEKQRLQKYRDSGQMLAYKRSYHYDKRYGVTVNQVENLLKQQEYKCAICHKELKQLGKGTHLDHCHQTKTLRGILCTTCNQGLGSFKDSTKYLLAAAAYLRSFDRDY